MPNAKTISSKPFKFEKREASIREMTDWLGLFVGPLCQTREDAFLLASVRNHLIKGFMK